MQCHYIDGQWTSAIGTTFTSLNPATNQTIWQGTNATPERIDQAIACARKALPSWRRLSVEQRQSYLQRFTQVLEQQQIAFAQTIAAETGKASWDAKGEVAAMLGKLAISLQAYFERTGERTGEARGLQTKLSHRPHGVCAVFGPFNFPGHLPNGHILPALLAGNTVIFKPSELTPRTAEHMVELWHAAGIPPGVLQLVQGERDTSIYLSQHPQLDGLFFTGSEATGRQLAQSSAQQMQKILALELGGHNPLVVAELNSAEISAAVVHALQSCFITTGQRCTCARKLILIQSPQSEQFLQSFIASAQQLTLTYQNEHGFMGPVISNRQAEALLTRQFELEQAGAQVLLRMTRPDAELAFVTPSIVDVSQIQAAVKDEEDFGPFVKVYKVASLDEALAIANATRFGLAAGLLGGAQITWQAFRDQVRAGIVNWNCPTTGASSAAPFGGPGASGNYRPGAYYAADYCAYPVASMFTPKLELPAKLSPGLTLVSGTTVSGE